MTSTDLHGSLCDGHLCKGRRNVPCLDLEATEQRYHRVGAHEHKLEVICRPAQCPPTPGRCDAREPLFSPICRAQDGRMPESAELEQWRRDALVLQEVGRLLADQDLTIQVRLPRTIADAVVEAWQRDDKGGVDVDVESETTEEADTRRQAAILALIGASVEEAGFAVDDEVVFMLDAWFIGDALTAADRAGVLESDSDEPH
jgi:hypothetical protein